MQVLYLCGKPSVVTVFVTEVRDSGSKSFIRIKVVVFLFCLFLNIKNSM